jgi:aspartyl-tRNA(Asn)/glutamyl-tRNA(Gln) amidotransferase subunit C
MSVDAATVRRIAHLARIAVADNEIEHLRGEINNMLAFVEQLNEVNVDGVEPTASVEDMKLKMRDDVVSDGDYAKRVLANAPATDDGFYQVPKVVE